MGIVVGGMLLSGYKERRPPEIITKGRPKHFWKMVRDAAFAVRLSGRAERLLQFYCSRSNRFTPSLKLIEEETGIAKNKVSEIRQELINHNMITYRPLAIIVEWQHIRAFALMASASGKRLTKQESKKSENFIKARSAHSPDKIKDIIAAHRRTELQRLLPPVNSLQPALTDEQAKLVNCLEQMTEWEYGQLVSHMPTYQPENQAEMIDWGYD